MFRVQLPNRTKLTHVELRRSRSSQTIARPTLGTVLRTLFFDLTNEELSWQVVDGLTPSMRLDLARDICSSLHRSVAGFPRATVPSLTEHDRDHPYDLPGHVDVHLTPPELAKAMASYAVSLLGPADGPVHFGDPAVGNGAFYAALLQVLPRSRIGSALGVDINSRQVEAARSRWGHRGLRVTRADYLHLERLPLRTLILANPPYLRHQDIPASYKKRLRERASVITHSSRGREVGTICLLLDSQSSLDGGEWRCRLAGTIWLYTGTVWKGRETVPDGRGPTNKDSPVWREGPTVRECQGAPSNCCVS